MFPKHKEYLLAYDLVAAQRLEIINTPKGKIGAAVCFESTFPFLLKKMKNMGAKFIIVVTNDAWFFDTGAVYQHFSVLPFRAVENRCYVIQAANTGISAIIDPYGKIVEFSKVNEKTILIGEIKAN